VDTSVSEELMFSLAS